MTGSSEGPALDRARELVGQAGRIVVLSGAGLSTDSGIPDFRGPQGRWTRDPEAERLSSIDHLRADPAVRRARWRGAAAYAAAGYRPNPGHAALTELARRRRVSLVVTQNTDGLHLASGLDPELLVEIHGHNREVRCERCDRHWPTAEVLARVAAGEDDPHCNAPVRSGSGEGTRCGGLLRPTVVLFGEALDPDLLRRAATAVSESDLLLCVGTSLAVYPVAGLVDLAPEAVVIANADPTPFDGRADVLLREPLSEVLPALVG